MEGEYKARILANELNRGDAREAADLVRHELYEDPRGALWLMQRARQMESRGGVDDLLIGEHGHITILNKYTGRVDAYAGQLPVEAMSPVVVQPEVPPVIVQQAPPPVIVQSTPPVVVVPDHSGSAVAGEAAVGFLSGVVGGLIGGVLGRGRRR